MESINIDNYYNDIKSHIEVIKEYSEYNFTKSLDPIKFLEVQIQDNGIGIPKNEIPEIFNRYKQVKGNTSSGPDYSGSGIGLNFTKRLVELHKGYIKVKSVVGQGSTF